MGSGAAVSVALMRALSGYLGHPLPQERISALAYEVERIHHGTPSGIDNTVVTFGRPVYFIRGGDTEGDRIETFSVARPFDILIGDTGMSSSTRQAVGDVGRAWQAEPERYNRLFEQIGSLVQKARQAIEIGEVAELGPLMDQNHALLCEMGVSSKELDELVAGARSAGALGAKLSGGGRGGNMIALVTPGMEETVAAALMAAGARSTLLTTISNNPAEVN
jgi:mevalonate kinase